MGSFEEKDNDVFTEHASYGVHDLSPRIGPEYQAEISFVIKKSEQLQMNPADSESVHDKSSSFEIGLPISVTWSDADTKSFLLVLTLLIFILRQEAYDLPDNDANKMFEIQKSQQSNVLDDNQLKRIIKYQFNRRVRSRDSNHVAVPIKRRRLTACAKAEERCIIENSSGGIGSDKLGFSLSSCFRDSNKNACDPISHQQNGNSTVFSAERIVEENNEKSIHNGNYQCTGVSYKPLSYRHRAKVCRLMSWLIKDEDSEYYQKLREFEYKKTARNMLNQVVLQKHQKSLANEVNRETDEAVIKTQLAEEKSAEEMQETEAFASSYGNQLASTSSAPNDDEVVILTKAKYERLLQSAEKVDKLEEKLLQIMNLLQQRNIVISDELTTQKVQLSNL
ncbi:hypothetical protein TSUD_345010 [Trifolium subterraneum]|nr:hypothetical protein TSUD_345010 [Trifolium subterraneum]